ncbi:hypothetical protein CONCODRAFT_13752 [Conidiobolus coronatus NRRL 28638]|uniref:Uncharacterized protein n=1 Tax=Conidiobolus coronatus (strain ATCC 28846 / CBS 209.66 / NRRL 28638) TaxID=796925 RepID=A0A137NQD1_CONC2|nr:hypothetical protein CONCODRAFT_13752 [Conidiobolus coronatus NRRL 28638]|eukprot:KXN64880.1 hypothetical protein CONCODRAFT_13752 [Conidiobolus coronatus NRRL 28638]
MDFNVMCQDPSNAWICSYISSVFNMQQFPDDGIDDCKPDRFGKYVGALYDPKSNSFKLKDGSVSTLSDREVGGLFRMMGPSTITTMEFNNNRLNIYYDNDSKKSEDPGTVTDVKCG